MHVKKALTVGTAVALGLVSIGLNSSRVSYAATPITLTVATWDTGTGLVNTDERAAKEFEKLHPNIKVDVESVAYANYLPKLLTEMANGSAPDVMLVSDTNVNEFVSSGMLEDLSPLFAKHFRNMHTSGFYANVLRIGSVEGQQYFVPKGWVDEAVLYNKQMFQNAHLPFPKPGWTLGQFLHDAVILTKTKDGRTVQWGAQLPGTWLRAGLEYYVNAFGGRLISPNGKTANGYMNSPKTERAISYYLGMYTKYGISPTPQSMTATFANVDLFASQKVAMEPTGPWNLSKYLAEPHLSFGVVPMPIGPTGKPVTEAFWSGWGVYKNTSHLQAANELIAFFSSSKWAAIIGQNSMTAIKGPEASVTERNDPLMKVFYEQAPYVQPLEPTETLNWSKDVSPPLTNLIEAAVISPKSNVHSLIQTAVKQIDANLVQDDN